MTSVGYNFSDFPENQLTKISCSLNSITANILSMINGLGPRPTPEASPTLSAIVHHPIDRQTDQKQ